MRLTESGGIDGLRVAEGGAGIVEPPKIAQAVANVAQVAALSRHDSVHGPPG